MTSAAVDIKTGEVYLDESGFIPENLNELMQPYTTLKYDNIKWASGNCAEFNVVNLTLNKGVAKGNLVIATIRVSNLAMKSMCGYCQKAMEGVLLVVSG